MLTTRMKRHLMYVTDGCTHSQTMPKLLHLSLTPDAIRNWLITKLIPVRQITCPCQSHGCPSWPDWPRHISKFPICDMRSMSCWLFRHVTYPRKLKSELRDHSRHLISPHQLLQMPTWARYHGRLVLRLWDDTYIMFVFAWFTWKINCPAQSGQGLAALVLLFKRMCFKISLYM